MRVEDVAAVIGTDDAAAIAAAVFPLVGRRTERPPGHRDGEWSAVALVSGVRVHGALCHVEWGPGMRPCMIGLPSVDRARLAEFGLTDAQVDEALGLASRHGTERVERNLAYVEAELARGKEIGALGAYVYRAIQGDWAGRAGIATRKRDAVQRAATAQMQTAWRSLFPPPALRRSAHDDASGAAPQPAQSAERVRWTFLRAVLLALLAAPVAGCLGERREPVPKAPQPSVGPVAGRTEADALVGVWDLAEVTAEFGECHEASIGYRADGRYVAKSGGQIVTGVFEAEEVSAEASGRSADEAGIYSGAPAGRRYLVSQSVQAHNGRPNCQGIAADVAVAVSPREAVIDVRYGSEGQPDEAWVYFDQDAKTPASVLVRRSSAQPERRSAGAAFPQLP